MAIIVRGITPAQQSIDISLALQRTPGQANDANNWALLVGFVLLILFAVGWVYLNIRNGQPFRIEASTTLPEDAAVDRIIEGYVRAGWSAVTLSDGRVLFSRTTRPDIGTTLFLALFFILPALLYLTVSQQRQTADMEVIAVTEGRTTVEILGNKTGWGGVSTAARILRELPKT